MEIKLLNDLLLKVSKLEVRFLKVNEKVDAIKGAQKPEISSCFCNP